MKIAHILNQPFIIDDAEYIALRNEITNQLLTLFDDITSYKDAAENDPYVSFVGRKGVWVATAVFHAKESYDHWKSGNLIQYIGQRIEVLNCNYIHATAKPYNSSNSLPG